MANMTLNQYLQQIQAAWEARSGTEVSELLSFKHPHVMSQKLIVENPENTVERIVESPLDELVICHLKCLYALSEHNYVEAYRHQSLLVQLFAKVFQSQKEDNWALFIMYTISVDLRTMAVKVDQELSKRGVDKPGETLEKAAESLMGLFRVCAGDNRTADEYTKRWGMLYLVNQLFKIYFRINKIHLCKPLVRAIEASQFKDQFSLSQQVTYKYFVGQKAMFDSDFKSAEDYLTYAFEHCHKKCRTNKRLILIYLIPVKMLLGHLPSLFLLQKYDLLQFTEVVQAVREGNLLHFQKALEQHEAFFIRCGIYLILEKLKVIAYRNLFKKVSLLMKTHQIPIEAFLAALKVMQVEDIDLDETQCILANLIYENKIKGYISHSHQKLVISKQNAFPPLASVAMTAGREMLSNDSKKKHRQ